MSPTVNRLGDSLSAPLSPFLNLPREIRDEIYQYLLIFDTCSILEPPPKSYGYWEPLDGISLDISILSVNRHKRWKWDQSYRISPPYHKLSSEPEPLLTPRYRQLIRRVKVVVHDARVQGYKTPWPDENDEILRRQAQKILMPAVHRLRKMLDDAKRSVHIDIVVRPLSLYPGLAQGAKLTESDVDALHWKFIREIAYTIWPLTAGGGEWSYTVCLGHPADRRFQGMKEEALRECDTDGGFSEEEEEGFRNIELESELFWAIRKGKLILVAEVSNTCCGGTHEEVEG